MSAAELILNHHNQCLHPFGGRPDPPVGRKPFTGGSLPLRHGQQPPARKHDAAVSSVSFPPACGCGRIAKRVHRPRAQKPSPINSRRRVNSRFLAPVGIRVRFALMVASRTRAQFATARDMLGQEAVGVSQIAKVANVSRQMIYRIKDDPASAEAALAAWGL
jgi:hypothetical protein